MNVRCREINTRNPKKLMREWNNTFIHLYVIQQCITSFCRQTMKVFMLFTLLRHYSNIIPTQIHCAQQTARSLEVIQVLLWLLFVPNTAKLQFCSVVQLFTIQSQKLQKSQNGNSKRNEWSYMKQITETTRKT